MQRPSSECDEVPTKRPRFDHSHTDTVEVNRIADLCYLAYSSLGKSGKPDVAKGEHTVLAAVLCGQTVVALATGTKCFPENVSTHRTQLIDCHAEPLVKRAFKCYLLSALEDFLSKGNCLENFYDTGKLYNCIF